MIKPQQNFVEGSFPIRLTKKLKTARLKLALRSPLEDSKDFLFLTESFLKAMA